MEGFSPGISQSDMIRASNAAVTAPTEEPNQRVAAKTNGSETESRATTQGFYGERPRQNRQCCKGPPRRVWRMQEEVGQRPGEELQCRPMALSQVCLPETRPRQYWVTSLLGNRAIPRPTLATRPK